MAAVRKRKGERATLVETKVGRVPGNPGEEAPPPAPPPPAAPGEDLVDPSERVFLVRKTLLHALEADRRDHDKLAQRARDRGDHDEVDGAKAVLAYLEKLTGRIMAGELG